MKSHEILQEPNESQEPIVFVQFGDIDPENFYIQHQNPRNRSIIMTSEYKPRGVQFWRDETVRHHQKADLRDLVLGEAGVTEEDLAGMIKSIGIETVRTKPRYPEKPEPLVTREELSQDEVVTYSGHILRATGQLPEPGVIQPQRIMPEPHKTRRRK